MALLLPASSLAEEVPLQSFEWNPMSPLEWVPGPFPGAVNYDDWLLAPALAGGPVSVTDLDASSGGQSLLLSRGSAAGPEDAQSRVELIGRLPLADIVPGFVDFWVRPTSWSLSIAGTQVFVDGHFFSFFSHYQAGNRYLRLSHHTQQSDHSWTTIPSSVLVPVRETAAPGDDVIATDWVRFTARVDPVTQTADVWLNGQLVITDAVRSPAYVAPFPGSFFLRAGLVEWEMGEMGSGEMGSGNGEMGSVCIKRH